VSDLVIDELTIDLDAKKLVEARVSSDLWKGARVPLEALTAQDRAWLFSLIERLARSTGIESGAWTLRGRAFTRTDASAEPARVIADNARGLETFLDVVAGTLLIDPGARAMQSRTKGDSPA
jgi:hypothetical protein